jgi:hypothetical protein
MLLVFFRVKTNAQDQHVELIQISGDLAFNKKVGIYRNKIFLFLINQETA